MTGIRHVGAGDQGPSGRAAEPSFQYLTLTLAYVLIIHILIYKISSSEQKTQCSSGILLNDRIGRIENTRVNLNISLPATGPTEKGERRILEFLIALPHTEINK